MKALDGVEQGIPDSFSPRSIFIYRPDHLGDLVLYSGTLKHLRQRWPAAHITLAVHPFGRDLFAHCPHVDSFFPSDKMSVPFEPLRTIPGTYWAVKGLRKMVGKQMKSIYNRSRRSIECDLAILPLVAPTRQEHAVMDLIPARTRVGIRGNHINQKFWTDLVTRGTYSAQMNAGRFPADLPELDTNRLFLKFLGIEASVDDIWPEFWTHAKDVEAAEQLMGENGGRRVLGIAPGVSNPKGKQLPAEWYGAVLAGVDLTGYDIVLLGGPGDSALCEQIVGRIETQRNGSKVYNFAGRTGILPLVECIRRCDVFLCPDAAPLHIATALRKPLVAIMGGGHFGRFYPWGDPTLGKVVQKKMNCYGCDWHCRYATMRCIQEIDPALAVRELGELLRITRLTREPAARTGTTSQIL